jgi:anti-sigma B factor antagonist
MVLDKLLKEAIVDLQVAVRESGDVTILDIQGRATLGPNNDLLRSQLQQAIDNGARKLLLNLTDVMQVDSSGFATIIRTSVALGSLGGRLKLLRPSTRVREALEVMRLPHSIPILEAETEAMASFR